MMIVIPIVIIAVVAGLAFAGIVNIPGITPKKALKNSAAMYTDKDGKPLQKKPAPVAKVPPKKEEPKKPAPKIEPIKKDEDQGADALAAVWNEIKTPELLKIAANWKDQDLAK